ncbi:MAG: hypothetical protein RCG15_02520 [Candidatus Rickettsia vulgarisii]
MVKFQYNNKSGNIQAFYQNQESQLSVTNKPPLSEDYSFGSFQFVDKNALGEYFQIKNGDHVYGTIYKRDITTNLPFQVNTKYNKIVTITKYRSILFPDKIVGGPIQIGMGLRDASGNKLTEKYHTYMKLDYNSDGKLIKLEVPNIVTVLPNTTKSPVITMYKGKICTLPLTFMRSN